MTRHQCFINNFNTKGFLKSHACLKETDRERNVRGKWIPLSSFCNFLLLPPSFLSFLPTIFSILSFCFFPSLPSFNPISTSLYICRSLLYFYPQSKPLSASKNLALLDLTKSGVRNNGMMPRFNHHLDLYWGNLHCHWQHQLVCLDMK